MADPAETLNQSHQRFTRALHVVVDNSVKETVCEEPEFFADALMPALLPAIKKTVTAFFSDLVATVEQILQRSFSKQSILWRVEAARTGRSFAEIAVLHSLVYRVDHVILIDHRSGLLLGHVSASAAPAFEADMVSGMVTALTDFVQESFRLENAPSSGSFKVGDYVVWSERGDAATLAAFVRGQPPGELRESLQRTLFQVEGKFQPLISDPKKYDELFEEAAENLRACLSASYRPPERASKAWWWVALGLLVLPLVLVGFLMIRSSILMGRYESSLKRIPGIIVLDSSKKWGKYRFSGLRDPFSEDPSDVFKKAGLDPSRASTDFKPFVSEEHVVLARRILSILNAPSGVGVQWNGPVVALIGSAPFHWIIESERRMGLFRNWVAVDYGQLKDSEGIAAEKIIKQVEQYRIYYALSSARVPVTQSKDLSELVAKLRLINDLAKATGRNWGISVEGFADSKGPQGKNRYLSERRAATLAQVLRHRGVGTRTLRSTGRGVDPREGRAARIIVRWGPRQEASVG